MQKINSNKKILLTTLTSSNFGWDVWMFGDETWFLHDLRNDWVVFCPITPLETVSSTFFYLFHLMKHVETQIENSRYKCPSMWSLLFSKESFVFLSCCHAAVYSFSMPTGYRGYHDTCSDLACNCYVQHLGRLFFGMSRNMVSTSTEHQVKPFWAQVQLAFTCSKSALSGLNTLKGSKNSTNSAFVGCVCAPFFQSQSLLSTIVNLNSFFGDPLISSIGYLFVMFSLFYFLFNRTFFCFETLTNLCCLVFYQFSDPMQQILLAGLQPPNHLFLFGDGRFFACWEKSIWEKTTSPKSGDLRTSELQNLFKIHSLGIRNGPLD